MGIIKLAIVYVWLALAISVGFCYLSSAVMLPIEVGGSKIRGPKLLATGNSRELKKATQLQPKRGCGEMASRSECSNNPKCRWCRSDALDDMCFSKSKAWRLPYQVFSCEF